MTVLSILAKEPWAIKLRQEAETADRQRREDIAREVKRRPTCRALIAMVADFYGLRSDEVTGLRRSRQMIEARRMACLLCRRHLPVSLAQIGRALNRDHSTVCHHLRRVKDTDFNWADFTSIQKMLDQGNLPEPVDNAHNLQKHHPCAHELVQYDTR